MRIDGKKIAEEIRRGLHKRIGDLISKGITPKIAIITLGDESSWESYVRQKLKVAEELGIKTVLFNLEDSGEEELLKLIKEIDSDPMYHGIIVQRPLPAYIDKDKIIEAISPAKDIDGFRPDSEFQVPVWMAVHKILEELLGNLSKNTKLNFTVLGKGETAGRPIADGLLKLGIDPVIIDSQTQNRDEILLNSDVVISCVGKSNVITSDQIKKDVILIGVGTHGEDGKLKGDFDQDQIEPIAKAYSPTPGGVGPVNLSFLFTNLVKAAEKL